MQIFSDLQKTEKNFAAKWQTAPSWHSCFPGEKMSLDISFVIGLLSVIALRKEGNRNYART
jgi:hypothetical protein